MLQRLCPRPLPEGEVVGFPIDPPGSADPAAFCREYGQTRPFALYLGRIDTNKGCRELFDYFLWYASRRDSSLDLLLAGKEAMAVPPHRRVRYLGFLSESAKQDALAAATCLVMPSPYESLSIVLLEAWNRGIPTLANGHCDVLRGQTCRSGGGLFYETRDDFADCLDALTAHAALREALGRSGQRFVSREYSWAVIRARVERLLLKVQQRAGRSTTPESSVG
jgi:glycosyltransferase involved in cell wall biosynthesis